MTTQSQRHRVDPPNWARRKKIGHNIQQTRKTYLWRSFFQCFIVMKQLECSGDIAGHCWWSEVATCSWSAVAWSMLETEPQGSWGFFAEQPNPTSPSRPTCSQGRWWWSAMVGAWLRWLGKRVALIPWTMQTTTMVVFIFHLKGRSWWKTCQVCPLPLKSIIFIIVR